MSSALAQVPRAVEPIADEAMWRLIAQGDLKGLNDGQKSKYYLHLCESMGLNPATQPFEYMTINGKYVLYAKKGATDQLRKINGVSVVKVDNLSTNDYASYGVTVQDREGRMDYEIGSVFWAGLKGPDRANADMKALTKAKRRATLSICGLGMLDETEVETIPNARILNVAPTREEMEQAEKPPTSEDAKTARLERFANAVEATSAQEKKVYDALASIPTNKLFDATTGEIIDAEPIEQWNPPTVKKGDLDRMHGVGGEVGMTHDDIKMLANRIFGVQSTKDLNVAQENQLERLMLGYGEGEAGKAIWAGIKDTLATMDATGQGVVLEFLLLMAECPDGDCLSEIARRAAQAGVVAEVKLAGSARRSLLGGRKPAGEAGSDRYTA